MNTAQRRARNERIQKARDEMLANYTTRIEIIDGQEVVIKVYEPVGKARLNKEPDLGVIV